MYTYEGMLGVLEATVPELCARQQMDRQHPECGAFVSQDLGCPAPTHRGHAHDLACACYVFMAQGSSRQWDSVLFQRICLAVAFLKRWQRPSGLIDGIVSNWESPNATAFTVQLLAPVVQEARRGAHGHRSECQRISRELGEYLHTASLGIIDQGFHTPNHRWVICSALAQAAALFPDLPMRDYVETILAEGIDMDADGQYSERSPGIYNAACDRSLRLMADYLELPELLDFVRRNLDLTVALLHPDWTVETGMSSRQDRGRRIVPFSLADSFFDMAQRDRNGVWATVADELAARARPEPPCTWLLYPFVSRVEYRTERLERVPLPDSCNRIFTTARLWRVREGRLSATAIGGRDARFSLRWGDVDLKAVKIGETFNNTATFETDAFEATKKGVRLTQHGNADRQRQFDLPLGRPVPFDAFYPMREERQHLSLPIFDVVLDVERVEHGFDLRLSTRGAMDRVTFQIECCFAAPGEWETNDQVIRVDSGQTAILKGGYGTYHCGRYGIRIGPGASAHRMWQMRGMEAEPECFRVLVPLQTPVDHTLRVRYGIWSTAAGLVFQ